jgi:hypothetical protein
MWAALAMTAALTAPAQAGELSVKNVRSTYGIFGQPRKDNKLLPGDVMVVACDIENLSVDKDGKVLYAMGMELTRTSKGKSKLEFKTEPQDREATNSLGGTTMPIFAICTVGLDSVPGEYTLKVTIMDRGKKKGTTVLVQKFEVLPVKLGFVQVTLTTGKGEAAPPTSVPGNIIYLNFSLVGFTLGAGKAPDVTFEMQVLDDAGKPTVDRAYKGRIKAAGDTPGLLTFLPIPLQLNRTGKFKVVLKATDNLTKKSTRQTLDLTVMPGQ